MKHLRKIIALSVLFFMLCMPTGRASEIIMGGGDLKDLYFLVGGVLCQIFGEAGEKCNVAVSQGSYENLNNTQNGRYDFSIVPESFAYRYFYRDPDNYLNNNIRGIFTMGDMNLLILVHRDSRINSLRDLKHKRLTMDADNEIGAEVLQHALSLEGVNPEDVEFKKLHFPSEEVAALCNKDTDALVLLDGTPSSLVDRLNNCCPVKFLFLPKKIIDEYANNYTYIEGSYIDGAAYYPILNSGPTLSTKALLISNTGVSPLLMSRFLQQFKKYFTVFKKQNDSLANLNFEEGFKKVAIPIHMGVKLFLYEESLKGKGRPENEILKGGALSQNDPLQHNPSTGEALKPRTNLAGQEA